MVPGHQLLHPDGAEVPIVRAEFHRFSELVTRTSLAGAHAYSFPEHDPGMGKMERQAILGIAKGQFGVVSGTQIRTLGLTTDQVRTLVNAGWLEPVYRGVYSVGRPIDRYEGWLMAGVLVSGSGSAVARSCAASHWGIGKRPGPIEIVRHHRLRAFQATSSQGNGRKLIVHRSRVLPDSEVTKHRGVPTTTVARTLLDIAPGLKISELRDVFNSAARRDMIDMEDIERVLDRGQGRHGSVALRVVADEWHPDDARARSKLENRFIRLCVNAGLGRPEQNVEVLGYEVDCLWRDQMVVVELDSVGFHSQPSELDRDRERDIVLRQNQFEVLRYTNWRIKNKPGWVVATLIEAMRRSTTFHR
jgi:very-short-patch-repair endonuclease